MNHLSSKYVASISAFAVLLLPLAVVNAEDAVPLVSCYPHIDESTGKFVDCQFSDLIKMANNIIGFLLYKVCVPLSALGFMFAGARLVIAQHKESAWSEAQESFTNIGKGFIIIMAAFIVVKFALSMLLSDEGEGGYKEFVGYFLGGW